MSCEAPTCVDAVLQPHALEVVVTSLFVLLKRATLLVAPPTISTLVGFSDCEKNNNIMSVNRAIFYEKASIKVINNGICNEYILV